MSVPPPEDKRAAARRLLAERARRVSAIRRRIVAGSLAAFGRRYPGVRLSLVTGNSETLLRGLLEHRSDVAVIANVPGDARLHALPLRTDRLVAFVDRRHPWARRRKIRLEELGGRRLVLREVGSTTRRLFEAAMARRGLPIGEVLEIGSREAIREAVIMGVGVGAVSEKEYIADPRLRTVRVSDAHMYTYAHVVCLAERREARLVRAFLGIVEELQKAPRARARKKVAMS